MPERHEFAGRMRDAIVARGHNGQHLLSEEEVLCVLGELSRQVAAEAEFDTALVKLDPLREGSFARRALVQAFARNDIPFDPDRLTPDAKAALCDEFSAALDCGAPGTNPAERFGDGILQTIAGQVASRFAEQRITARAAVEQLPADPDVKEALLAQVTCDNIPAKFVPALWRARIWLHYGGNLADLANELPQQALAANVAEAGEAIDAAIRESGIGIQSGCSGRMVRHAWRFLLAPGGPEQAAAIHRQLARDECPLRDIAQAAAWYTQEFAAQEESDRIIKGHAGLPVRAYPLQSFYAAATFFDTATGLNNIVRELAGVSADPVPAWLPKENVTDQTITTLRNIGIPYPPPFRVGEKNERVPLSSATLAEINDAFRGFLEGQGAPGETGLVPECETFLRDSDRTRNPMHRARYVVDGVQVPQNANAVVQALRNFCTDPHGELNPEMLKKISMVANHAPVACAYAGCMNPDRPDLAILNGYPRGVLEAHEYSLSKTRRGAIRLKIVEHVSPVFYYPVNQHTLVPPVGYRQHDDAHPRRYVRLNGDDSNFLIRVTLSFDRQTFDPTIDDIEIHYDLRPLTRISHQGPR